MPALLIAVTVATHLKKTDFHITIILLFLILSCKKTSTPNEYLNKYEIDIAEYENDKIDLTNLTRLWRDSISTTSATPEGKTLNIYIDTIFYSPDNKFVFLSITKKENQYATNKEGISYSGECYIGVKNTKYGILKIIDKLKYRSTASEYNGFDKVKKSNRHIYLTEIGLIDNKYNINDTRFWTRNLWTKK